MRRRPKSIRSTIIMSLIVPVLALSGLWAFNVHTSFADALELRGAYSSRDEVGRPCDLLLQALQTERSRSQEFLAVTPRTGEILRVQRASTDAAAADFRRLASAYTPTGEAADITRARITDMITALTSLARVRSQIDAGSIPRAAALSAYNGIITAAFAVLSAAASFSDLLVERVMRTVLAIRQAGELFSQEDALLTGAATARRFGNGEYLQLIKTVGALRFQILAAGSGLPEIQQTVYFGMLGNPTFKALQAVEDRVIRDGRTDGPVPVALAGWRETFNPVARQINDFVVEGYDKTVAYARDAADRILMRFSVTGGLGMVAILLSLVLAIRIGRSVVNRLSALRAAALDVAGRRLPEVVERLRAGEQVHVDSVVPRPPPDGDEIADVGFALGEVHRSAIGSAVAEAELRRGMGKVLVNSARRNQTLIDRQLRALAQLRDAGTGPQLTAANVAERLAMRMRRNAEHLVILAGSARSQGRYRPVSLSEIIGDAVGGVEDGDRIELRPIAGTLVPGRAAADVVHLLTELLENATVFSPPDTPVRVSARRVPPGIAVEIEDRGLGMSAAAIREINQILAEPPDFDPANSARLGLFVVAQLAAQRGITVSLRSSSAGGVTAAVLLPPDLIDATAGPVSRSSGQPALLI